MLDVYVNDDLEPGHIPMGRGTGGGMHVPTVVMWRLGAKGVNDRRARHCSVGMNLLCEYQSGDTPRPDPPRACTRTETLLLYLLPLQHAPPGAASTGDTEIGYQ